MFDLFHVMITLTFISRVYVIITGALWKKKKMSPEKGICFSSDANEIKKIANQYMTMCSLLSFLWTILC